MTLSYFDICPLQAPLQSFQFWDTLGCPFPYLQFHRKKLLTSQHGKRGQMNSSLDKFKVIHIISNLNSLHMLLCFKLTSQETNLAVILDRLLRGWGGEKILCLGSSQKHQLR